MCGYIDGVTCKWCRFDSVDALINKQTKYKAYCFNQATSHSGVARSISNSDDAAQAAVTNMFTSFPHDREACFPPPEVSALSVLEEAEAHANVHLDGISL